MERKARRQNRRGLPSPKILLFLTFRLIAGFYFRNSKVLQKVKLETISVHAREEEGNDGNTKDKEILRK